MYITKEQMESHAEDVIRRGLNIKETLVNLMEKQIQAFIDDLPRKLPDLFKGLLDSHPDIQALKKQEADNAATIADLKAKVEAMTSNLGKTVPFGSNQLGVADGDVNLTIDKPDENKQ